MTLWSDMDSEMQPLPLDAGTADRLLAGAVAPEDAPPGYARVVRLLEAVSAEASSEELGREPKTVAAMEAALRPPVHRSVASPRRSFRPFALSRPRLAAAVVAAAFAATIGTASAGSLPGAAQDVAAEMLAKVGITVPGANDSAGTHPDERGNSTSVPIAPADVGKGSEISELATTTDLTGVEKGVALSTAASGGKSQAEQHDSASGAGAPVETPNSDGTVTADTASGGKSQAEQHDSASGAGAPVETPNSGGTVTADTASGGKSSTGTATADAASGGKSAAGLDNASNGP